MICNDCGECRCECNIEEEDDIILDCEAQYYITFKYNSENISPEALFNCVQSYMETDGFTKIIDIEIK